MIAKLRDVAASAIVAVAVRAVATPEFEQRFRRVLATGDPTEYVSVDMPPPPNPYTRGRGF